MIVEVHVTAEHIAKGEICNCTDCPVALALVDAGLDHPRCGSLYVTTSGGMKGYLPESARRFIRLFDQSGPRKIPVTPGRYTFADVAQKPEPFSFTLELTKGPAYPSYCNRNEQK